VLSITFAIDVRFVEPRFDKIKCLHKYSKNELTHLLFPTHQILFKY